MHDYIKHKIKVIKEYILLANYIFTLFLIFFKIYKVIRINLKSFFY